LLGSAAVLVQAVVLMGAAGDSRMTPVLIYGGALLALPLAIDGMRAHRSAAARHRAMIWAASILALETVLVGVAVAAGGDFPGTLAVHIAPLVIVGAALWQLCAPTSREVPAGAALPWSMVPLGVVSTIALEAVIASFGHDSRLIFPKIAFGRGFGELALLIAICGASRLPAKVRAFAMPALAAGVVVAVAAISGSALLLTGSSLDEGLVLVAAGGALFGLASDVALGQRDRVARAQIGIGGYLVSGAPLLVGSVLASGTSVIAGELPRLVAFAVVHGLLLGWATPNGRVVGRRIKIRWPAGLRRAVGLTALLPWVWLLALMFTHLPREAHLIIGAIALGISIVCAIPALFRTATAHLLLRGQLVVAAPIVLGLAMGLHHDTQSLIARVGIAALAIASFWLIARAATRLADADVQEYFGVGIATAERPTAQLPSVRAIELVVACAAIALVMPAAMRSAGRWHLAGAPMAVATAIGPDGQMHTGGMPATRSGGPVVLDPERRIVYVADGDRGELVAVDADAMTVRDVRSVGALPTQLVLGTDGTLFATVRGTGAVVAWSRDGALRTAQVGGEPWGLARSDDGRTLFVSLATDDEVVALDTRTLAQKWRTPVAPRPRALAVTPSGRVLVGHVRESNLSVLDGGSGRALHELPLVADGRATPTQAWAFAGAGDDVVVFHAEVLTGINAEPVPSGGYGGGETEPMVARITHIDGRRISVVDVPRELRQQNIDLPRGVSQPDSAASLPDGTLVVADLGSDLVHLLSPAGERTFGVPGGPAGLAVDAYRERIFVWAAFDRQLRVYQLSDRPTEQARLAFGASGLPELADRGRRLFHKRDTRISNHGMACANCHPEGREDGMTWRLEGTRRQTPSLAGRLEDTAPYNWLGSQPTLEGNLTQTIQRLGGTGLSSDDTTALVTYIRDYLPAPQHHAKDHDALVKAGAEIFRRADVGCARCHLPEAGFSDGLNHDIGTTTATELREMHSVGAAVATAYETPSLRHLALTAPYLHDGSARDLDEVLRRTDGAMGHTGHLRAQERKALLAYLASL
jgi:DNA-binding beta-propeller fold protein YncE